MAELNQDLTDLENLFNSDGWKVLKKNIEQVFKNADNALHTISCSNRDIFVGKCLGVDEILGLEDILKEKINTEKDV